MHVVCLRFPHLEHIEAWLKVMKSMGVFDENVAIRDVDDIDAAEIDRVLMVDKPSEVAGAYLTSEHLGGGKETYLPNLAIAN